MRAMVRASRSSACSSASLEMVRGSASFCCIASSWSSRAWFSGLVTVSITNGRPMVVVPRVSSVTRSLVLASFSK